MTGPAATAGMPRWQRAYVIAMCAVIGGAFAYAACDWAQWPRLTYYPLTGALAMEARAGAITINYLGVFAWGVGGAAVGAIAGWLLSTITRKPWRVQTLQVFGAWAITAVVLTGMYYTWNLWPW
jgi:hypothetical protein